MYTNAFFIACVAVLCLGATKNSFASEYANDTFSFVSQGRQMKMVLVDGSKIQVTDSSGQVKAEFPFRCAIGVNFEILSTDRISLVCSWKRGATIFNSESLKAVSILPVQDTHGMNAMMLQYSVKNLGRAGLIEKQSIQYRDSMKWTTTYRWLDAENMQASPALKFEGEWTDYAPSPNTANPNQSSEYLFDYKSKPYVMMLIGNTSNNKVEPSSILMTIDLLDGVKLKQIESSVDYSNCDSVFGTGELVKISDYPYAVVTRQNMDNCSLLDIPWSTPLKKESVLIDPFTFSLKGTYP